MKKLTSLILSLFILLALFPIRANATINSNKGLELDKTNFVDSLVLKSEEYQKRIKNDPTYRVVSRKEVYYKFEKTNDNIIMKTEYTPSQYNAAIEKEAKLNQIALNSITLNKSYGWINVGVYGLVNSSNHYFIMFTYDWLKVPFWAATDAIVLGASDNLPIYSETLVAKHTVVADKSYVFDYTWSSPDMKSRGSNTYGINVPLRASAEWGTSKCWGTISADATRESSNITSTKIFGSYGHREVSVGNLGFSFSASGMGFSFPLTLTYDEAPISAVFSIY